jgi:hypothetical protein
MGSKGKIIDAFTQAYDQLAEISLPDGANGYLRQMQRAFTELRQHDSGQAKIVEETQAALLARDNKLAELQHEAGSAVAASRAKDAKIISQGARIAALENEIKTLAILIRKRLMPKSDEEMEKNYKAFEKRLETAAREFIEDCNPSPAVQRSFHRCGKVIINEDIKDLHELSDVLDTYQHLVLAACLQYGPLMLPASLPVSVEENAKFHLVKQEDGRWSVEGTAASAETAPLDETGP